MTMLLGVIFVALIFEFLNGFHDTANSVSAAVGTKVLSPNRAIALASVMNLCGALAGTAVATTVGKGLVESSCVTSATLICGLSGAIFWNLLTWWLGLPSSSSHALIGGLIGAAVASSGNDLGVIIWSSPIPGKPWYAWGGLLYKVIIPMFSSPIIGFVASFCAMEALYMVLKHFSVSQVNGVFRRGQILSTAFLGFSQGSNDAQKTMGIITLALFTSTQAGHLTHTPSFLSFMQTPEFSVPLWVKLLCAFTMAAGTASGGRRIIKTLGRKMARLQSANGFTADTTAATILLVAAKMGMPVSTTHAVSTSIMGAGTARNPKTMKWHVVESIIWTWFMTLPATALAAYGLMSMVRLFHTAPVIASVTR
jgi:inorganic phosphate transporter, PiT family